MQPPASISWLVNAVGEDAALLFIESAGGQRIMVPRKAPGTWSIDNIYTHSVRHHADQERNIAG